MDLAMKEFVAYSKRLLYQLQELREALNESDIDKAKKIVDRMIADTESDIEA